MTAVLGPSLRGAAGSVAICVMLLGSLTLAVLNSTTTTKASLSRLRLVWPSSSQSPETKTITEYSPTIAQSSCEGSRLVAFRYRYGCGGLGDLLKGMVAVKQVAHLAGRPFVVDLTGHPFHDAMPLVRASMAAPACIAALADDSRQVYSLIDWTLSDRQRGVRDLVFAAAANDSLSDSGVAMKANINHTKALVDRLDSRKGAELIKLERAFYATLYSETIDGASLRSYWPLTDSRKSLASDRPYRVALHVRFGDRHIGHISSYNKTDDRVVGSAIAEIEAAVRAVPKLVAETLKRQHGWPRRRSVVFFACADSRAGRSMLLENLASDRAATVVVSPWEPVHVAFPSVSDRPHIHEEARSVLREHMTLATADELYMVTRSGFSVTACYASIHATTPRKKCFARSGREWIAYA